MGNDRNNRLQIAMVDTSRTGSNHSNSNRRQGGMNMDTLDSRLKEVLHMMLNIKTTVYAEYSDTAYDEDYLDDIMEELDNATDAIRGAIALV